jgi:hypothetical protein
MPVKIKLSKGDDISTLRSVENKLLMTAQGVIVMFTGVHITEEEERYGRKNNKTRQVRYLNCTLHGYNSKGELLGTHDTFQTEYIVRRYDLFAIRRKYLDHIKALEAMQVLEEQYNEPDFVKAEPV